MIHTIRIRDREFETRVDHFLFLRYFFLRPVCLVAFSSGARYVSVTHYFNGLAYVLFAGGDTSYRAVSTFVEVFQAVLGTNE